MIIKASTPQKIVQAKPRIYMLIGNLTNSTVYISKEEYSNTEDYVNNCFALKQNGLLEISPCGYMGSFYAYSTEESDLRVLEL